MLNNSKQTEILLKYKYDTMQQMLDNAYEVASNLFINELKELDIKDYRYTTDAAVEELGLDEELINQLIEDYINQILHSNSYFVQYIEKLQDEIENSREPDYTDLRELAHKNLGVARNLRIEDAQKLLYEIMKNNDLDYILKCLEALMASAILLKPKFAYDVLTLIKTKESI